jgi:hypothetical protein
MGRHDSSDGEKRRGGARRGAGVSKHHLVCPSACMAVSVRIRGKLQCHCLTIYKFTNKIMLFKHCICVRSIADRILK